VLPSNLVNFGFWEYVLVLMHLNKADLAHGQLITIVMPTNISRNEISQELNATRFMISTVLNVPDGSQHCWKPS